MAPKQKQKRQRIRVKTKKFECSKCNKSFVRKSALEKHELACTTKKAPNTINVEDIIADDKRFKCKECAKRFKFIKSFNEHMLMDHSKTRGSVACSHPDCTVRCPDAKTLKLHISKVHERQIFSCKYCNQSFVRHSHVLRHLAQKGCNGNATRGYPCSICSSVFNRKDNLMAHLRTFHINKAGYRCKVHNCDFATKVFQKLIIHTEKYHAETPKRFECDNCGKTTGSRAAMIKHMEIHGEKKFSCDTCGYTTYSLEVMRRHVLTHSTDKPFRCNICSASFIQRVQLKRHLSRHLGIMCFSCGSTFDSQAKLLVHGKSHAKVVDKVCPMTDCTEEFPDDAAMIRHVQDDHLNAKPFVCAVCGKGYPSASFLQRHLSQHELHRPRRCMYCVQARAYIRGAQLLRHVRTAHPAVFRDHLAHVRRVMGKSVDVGRVCRSELESVLAVIDSEAERILEGYGPGVLYGGMQVERPESPVDNGPQLAENELASDLRQLLAHLLDADVLEALNWPDVSVDDALEQVIEQCGARPANKERYSRIQRLRENTKHLFLYVIEDKDITSMLDTHTIDQIVKHILKKVSEDNDEAEVDVKPIVK